MYGKILIVEDHDDSRKAMRTLLESEGYIAIEAKNGFESIIQARESVPDVVLMDLDLPRMDGVSAAARIKSIPALLHTRIIAVTGRTEQEQTLSSSDFVALVRKPMNYARFLALLAAAIPRRSAQQP